jgi:hypothetical protein
MQRLGPQSGDYQGWLAATLTTGSPAPDFKLPDARQGGVIQLRDFRDRKPLVLVFASFSCNQFCDQAGPLQRLYERYQDRAAFLLVYVAEAGHRIRWLEQALQEKVPAALGRRERARLGADCLGLTLPCALDDDQGSACFAYDAWPRRLVLVDKNGKVALDCGRGLGGTPWDFARVEAWLEHQPG